MDGIGIEPSQRATRTFNLCLTRNACVPRVSKAQAAALVKESLGADATFRPQQWEAIDTLVNDGGRLLLVQRTG